MTSVFNVKNIEIFRKIADILAIPFFILIIYFLLNIPKKNTLVYIILAATILALIFDIIFTINLVVGLPSKQIKWTC